MTINEKYNIVDFLTLLAIKPTKINGFNYWYNNAIRIEKTASFKVDQKNNLWYDFGIGVGGNLIDLGYIIFKTSDYKCVVREIVSLFSCFEIKTKIQETPKVFAPRLLANDVLTDYTFLEYLANRGIDNRISTTFCRQIKYQNHVGIFKAIGFENSSGGFELRTPNFKSCILKKDISFFDNGFTNLVVFEGFMDFLSYLMLPEHQILQSNYLVLNSVSLVDKLIPLANWHKQTYLFLDNDEAGKNCVLKIQNQVNTVIVKSDLYPEYKDLNEFLNLKK